MLVNYKLYDKEGDLLMNLKGKKYIAPIGSNVIFHDTAEDMWIEFEGEVTDYMYNIYSDTLCISCEIIEDLTDYDHEELTKFYTRKS
jgi:hypothetical protein